MGEPARTPSVLVLAPPSASDPYYAPVRDQLLAFYGEVGTVVAGHERVLLVVDAVTQRALADRAPARALSRGTIADIWLRDFAAVQVGDDLVNFSYRPRYLSRGDARTIEDSFLSWLRRHRMPYRAADLVLDGGNIVRDGAGRAVVSERVLHDNAALDRGEIVARLRKLLALDQLALVPEPPGSVLGHADGMVAWARPGALAVSAYAEPFRSALLRRIEAGFRDVEVFEIPFRPTDLVWRGFQDATGVYANVLATASRLYVPTYRLADDDAVVARYAAFAVKPVVALDSTAIAPLGGALNCISWPLRGALAERLLDALPAG